MKTLITILLLHFTISSIAQDSLVVTEITKEFSKGNHPAYSVRMPLVKVKEVKSRGKYDDDLKVEILRIINGSYLISD